MGSSCLSTMKPVSGNFFLWVIVPVGFGYEIKISEKTIVLYLVLVQRNKAIQTVYLTCNYKPTLSSRVYKKINIPFILYFCVLVGVS